MAGRLKRDQGRAASVAAPGEDEAIAVEAARAAADTRAKEPGTPKPGTAKVGASTQCASKQGESTPGGSRPGAKKPGAPARAAAKPGGERSGSKQPEAVAARGPRVAEAFMPSRHDHKGLTGQLLIAMPSLASPDFARTVIYLCAHTPEGAMGIVVNRPLENPSFDSLLKQLGVEPLPPVRRIGLGRGGPVDNARGFVLHTADWKGEGSLLVDDAVALTASLDILKAIADGGGPRDGFLALGYAGWGPGQLDEEIQQNAWLSVPASLDVVFGDDAGSKWRRALALLHIDPSALATTAGHG